MRKSGTIFILLTFLFVGIIAYVISLYARGYRVQRDGLAVHGFLILKSHPESAEVYVDGVPTTFTSVNLTLSPATYNIRVRKEGFIDWEKRLTIEAESVTEITAHLFRSAPSLSANTFSGVFAPSPSPDMTKVAYIVPFDALSPNSDAGLWIMETVNLPLGFNREPRQVTDGNLNDANFVWSPNGREILLTTPNGIYLVDTNRFTPQAQKVNIASRVDLTRSEWDEERYKKLESRMKKLPDELSSTLLRNTSSIMFSPDEKLVLYTASGSANLADTYKKPLPGSSSQAQARTLLDGYTYVYDIEEDKNFLVDDIDGLLTIEGGDRQGEYTRRISWLATSRHLVLAEENEIIIMDYDGTNRKRVYAGSYVPPHAYPTVSFDRILILTNLGAGETLPNIYTLSLK